jgi:hypothetical protein
MGSVYEVVIEMGSDAYDTYSKFHKVLFRDSKVNAGVHSHTDSMELA